MIIQSAMLWSDWLIYILLLLAIGAIIWMRRTPHLRDAWRYIFKSRLGMLAFVILFFYATVGLLDSIHLRIIHVNAAGQHTSIHVKSVLDIVISPLGQEDEKTYSAPFATHLFTKALVAQPNGKEVRGYARLKYGGAHLTNPATQKIPDIIKHLSFGALMGIISAFIINVIWLWIIAYFEKLSLGACFKAILHNKTPVAWREAMLMVSIIVILIALSASVATDYHILGTGKVGRDIFYEALKSIRTGLLIGTLTTLFMLPFALFLGTLAGFFRGWVDDVIQYLYTTLSSIPGVLLISATILVMQIFIANHAHLFPTIRQRADARLLALCLILGITTWASLCRLLRGETLKLRQMEYVQAARTLGVGNFKIILKHIMPNVMHIVLITLVLDFSGLVLAEAVLSYVGVGVDPTTMSWGNMINSSRLELAREPLVWWPLVASLIFMFLLVLSANLFADRVRDAFDPRLRNSEEQ